MSLKAVLDQVSAEFLKGGGGVSSSTKKALRAHRQKMIVVFTVLSILLLAATALSVYLLLTGSSQWQKATAVLGIGAGGGLLEGLRRIWKDWSQTDLLLILIEDAGEAEIAAIIKKLTRRL